MANAEMTEHDPLPAGAFSAWLRTMQSAIRGERDADVPCGGCTACCASSQFVHIGPDETETLSAIPRELLFPAPRMPGHLVLGYDAHGRCPMLTDAGCSIYERRPRTCRTYDCRVFPAAGVEPDDKPLIAQRARRWRFDFPSDVDRIEHDALRAAAVSVRDHADLLDSLPPTPTQIAVLAVETCDALAPQDSTSDVHREQGSEPGRE